MNQNTRIILLIALAGLLIVYFAFDLGQYFDFEYLKQKKSLLNDYKSAFPLRTVTIYFCIFVIVTSLSLPGAGIMVIAGGAIFGILWGTILSSFASVTGGTIAFLIIRYLFKDIVQNRFAHSLTLVNKGIEQDGAYYLFMLRLVPVFPYFIINILMGLTSIPVLSFYTATQLGMLAGIIVLANAGTQIAKINGPEDIFSPGLILSLILLGVFPLLMKKIILAVKSWRANSKKL